MRVLRDLRIPDLRRETDRGIPRIGVPRIRSIVAPRVRFLRNVHNFAATTASFAVFPDERCVPF